MSKRFRNLFKSSDGTPPPAAWSCVITYDPAKPDDASLQILNNASPPVEQLIFVLGRLRDALLERRGAALMQQAMARQAQEQQAQEKKN